jgi:hypothetical protein
MTDGSCNRELLLAGGEGGVGIGIHGMEKEGGLPTPNRQFK